MRKLILLLAVLVLLADFAAAKLCPEGDLNGDCEVNLEDILVFADQWLNIDDCPQPGCADFDGINGIDIVDFSVLAVHWQECGIPLVINEFAASNNSASGIKDPQGEYADWIEIYNFGDTPINLAGMYLTDDLGNPIKWQIPSGYSAQTTVPAKSFVVIWADEDTQDGPLHANFKLSASGEDIGLFAADGSTLIDSITFGEQATNISYGRYPDADDNLRYFAVTTPLAGNDNTYFNFVSEIEVSRERGFYENDFDLLLACETNGAAIRYTLDGTEPSETVGTVYTPGVGIPIRTTTSLRAIAYKAGEKPSRVTHTYIFIDDVAQQPANPPGWPSNWGYNAEVNNNDGSGNGIVPSDYEMDQRVVTSTLPGYSIRDALLDIPTFCISMKPDDFISDASGLWANPSILTEYKCSIEYIPINGTHGFQYDCKIENHGGSSRRPWRMQKHSLRLTFTSQYGPAKLNYPLFPESSVENFNKLLLRASFTDSWGLVSWMASRYRPNDSQYLRDFWMKESFHDMGQPSSYGNFVQLYVNGLYFGLYNLTEMVGDNDFLSEHFGGQPEDWEIDKDFGSSGSMGPIWNKVASQIDPTSQAGYLEIQNYIDVENFADYMFLHFYADAEDWPSHNGSAAANPVSGDGKLRFFVWDQEIVLDNQTLASSRIDNTSGVGKIFQNLRKSAEFRLLFADRVQKHCFNDGALNIPNSQNRYLEAANRIDKAIVAESARWGDTKMKTPYSNALPIPSNPNNLDDPYYPTPPHGPNYYFTREDSWVPERDCVVNHYIPEIHNMANSSAIIKVLRSKNPKLFPSIDAPVFNVNGTYKFGGYVSASDTFTITDPGASGGTIYYTIDGNDPRTQFTGAVSSTAIAYSGGFNINQSTKLKSRIYKSSTSEWSTVIEAVYEVGNIRDSLRITEIMYHPNDPNDPNDPGTEYVELKNTGTGTINLNRVKFNKGIDFTFGSNILTADQYILVVKNKNAFEAKYGTGKYIAGQYTGSLDNGGERIRLDDALGNPILDFEYKDGWRSIVDGDGYSLTIIEPTNPDVNSWGEKESWRASAYVNGSPDTDDSGIIPNPGSIVINEVLAHSDDSAPDWIELYNTTANTIDISGWYLSDNETNPLKYRFAAGTVIAGHGYWIVTETANFGQLATDPGRLIPFALSENGEMVCLASALDSNDVLTGYRAKEDFGASDRGVSLGRHYKASTNTYNFVSMDHNTSGAANAYPKVGPIVITEIMYHPNWPAGGAYVNNEYEYIELYNAGGSPVTLYDAAEKQPWKFTNGIDYTFAGPPNVVAIPAGGKILVVKNPTAFRWRYPSVPVGIIYGPYSGWLANDGEQLELSKPGDTDEFGARQYIRVERVGYSDGSHPGEDPVEPDLWPIDADGGGKSLGRKNTALYGNDPNNWQAITPTPGT
ncbi:MAG: hypothetical protein FJ263_06715 [Planctomycetes bacterium]|nr:hypothetical protein [Planctomycetota bacterium]